MGELAHTMIGVKAVKLLSGFYRCVKSQVQTTIDELPIKLHLNQPFLSPLVKGDASESAGVIRSLREILIVFSAGYITQVFESVIQSVSILMTNFKTWHFSGFKKPNDSMHKHFGPIHGCLGISLFPATHYIPDFITHIYSVASSFFPIKLSCFGVISKKLFSPLISQVDCLHDAECSI